MISGEDRKCGSVQETLKPDEYNRRLRRQLEQEWDELRKLREAEKPQQQPVTWSDYEPDGRYHNKPAKQPVAYIGMIDEDHFADVCRKANGNSNTPLYTSPPAQQEPVAWTTGLYGGYCVIRAANPAAILPLNIALYTSPPQRTWVGLTVDEMVELVQKYRDTPVALVDTTEAKLKEKNA